MMSAQHHISASCIITNNKVIKNSLEIFSAADKTFGSFILKLYQHLNSNYPKFYKMDNLSKLGWLASEVLLKGSFHKNAYKPEEVGLLLSNANASFDADIKYWESAKETASPSLFVYTLPNIVIGEICIRNNFKGEHAFYIMPQFNAAFIKQQVDYLLNNNILGACICGWVDFVGEDYKAALFLVEKKAGGVAFTVGELEKIFASL